MNEESNTPGSVAGPDEPTTTLEPAPARTPSRPIIDIEPPAALRAKLIARGAVARAVRSWPAIAAALLVLLLGGAAALDRFWIRAGTGEAASSRAVVAKADAGAAWRRLDHGDIAALARFASDYPQSPYARAARTTMATLEAEALTAIGSEPDLGIRIQKLDVLLSRVAGTAAAAAGSGAAATARAELARRIEALEADLESAGYFPGLVDGVVSAQTREAARALRLRVSGENLDLIDAALIAQAHELAEIGRPAPAGSSTPATHDGAVTAGADTPATPGQISVTDVHAPPISASAPNARPFKDCFVCPEMVATPVGEALIGDAEGVGQIDERPARAVRFSRSFALSRFEVTREEWAACASEGACPPLAEASAPMSARAPTTGVSYADARGYAIWLTRKTGRRYRLPSEAEWEFAARAGARQTFGATSQPEALCRHANHADSSAAFSWRNRTCADGFASSPAPVGSFEPNAFGLYDMSGNVWEWVEDCWHPTYDGAPTSSAAWTEGCDGSARILRGGAYSVKADYVRPGYRYPFDPSARFPFFGMRVARDLP